MELIRRPLVAVAVIIGLVAGAVGFAYYGEALYRGTWCPPGAAEEGSC